MAMEDPLTLLPMNMSFNPFRTTHPSSTSTSTTTRPQQQRASTVYDSDNDSWHTHGSQSNNSHSHHHQHHHNNSQQHHVESHSPYNRLSARSWFSSWTSTTTTTSSSSASSLRKTTTATKSAVSSAIIIHDDPPATHSANTLPVSPAVSLPHAPLSSQVSPAKSMTMNRGMTMNMNTPKPQQMQRTTPDDHHHNALPHQSRSSSLPLHNNPNLATAAGGIGSSATHSQNNAPSASHLRSASQIKASVDQKEVYDNDLASLPPYPEWKKAPQKHIICPTRTDSALLEDFPKPKAKAAPAAAPVIAKHKIKPNSKPTTNTTSATQPSFRHKQIFEESTFPGFALFQMSKAHYCLGRYSQALDTTADCLTFQKKSFAGNKGSDGSAAAAVVAVANNTKKGMPSSSSSSSSTSNPKREVSKNNPVGSPAGPINQGNGNRRDANDTMTALDLRTQFVTGVSSSVLGVVKTLKGSSELTIVNHIRKHATNIPYTHHYHHQHQHEQQQQQHHHHPMLSNTIAALISQYPTHPCIAHTLLLRGHLFAQCGLSEFAEDAIRHVEMAIAIQRNLALSDDEELAAPLLFLANMKTKLGQYDEADMAYKEAIFILIEVRNSVKHDHSEAVRTSNTDVARDCARYLRRITRDIAAALYLHGKSYHRQRLHVDAFDCYNNALLLLKDIGMKKEDGIVKRIVRCMKSRGALEKLVGGYWDDSCVV